MQQLDSVASLESATTNGIGSLAFATTIGVVAAVEATGGRCSIVDFTTVGCFEELASRGEVQLGRFEGQLPLQFD